MNTQPDSNAQQDSGPAVRYLGDMQRLDLQSGDSIVISISHEISMQECDLLMEHVNKQLPDHKVLILGPGMKLGVVGASAGATDASQTCEA